MNKKSVIEKWKNAVVHLEFASDSEDSDAYFERLDYLQEKVKSGEVDKENFEMYLPRTRDVRKLTTAVFVKFNGLRYLITAKHSVYDQLRTLRLLRSKFNKEGKKLVDQSEYEKALEKFSKRFVFNTVFRVPKFDEVINEKKYERPLLITNLNKGEGNYLPYLLSYDEDIAIISLDVIFKEFANDLNDKKYEAIDIELDSEMESFYEGQNIFTVGFPGATSIIEQRALPRTEINWSSSNVSMPVFTFGKIAMYSDKLNWFWADMSVFPGNSGGPVICQDTLAGIVSKQPSIGIELAISDSNLKYAPFETRIPFAKIIKTKSILSLLQRQYKIDAQNLVVK